MTTLSRLLLTALICCCNPAWSAPGDFDNDGVPDEVDIDSDNDGIPNINEGTGDSDFDGLPDFLDLDSDNDTIPDLIEVIQNRNLLATLDSDLNGQIDAGVLLGGNGFANALEVVADSQNINFIIPDSDSDLVPDHRDLDSDNDGLNDRIEYRNIRELRLAQIVGISDPDGNGLDNTSELLTEFFDTDGDTLENAVDIDSDQDGLSDLLETAGVSADVDNNGRVDQFLDIDGNGLQDSLQGAPLQFVDSDNDGLANHQDLDSDNDGAFDAQEASFPNVDGIFVSDQPAQEEPEVAVDPTTNPSASTGSETVVSTEDETTTSTVTSSGFDPLENPIQPANTTVTTGRDGSVFGGCTISTYANGVRSPWFAALEWLLLLSAVWLLRWHSKLIPVKK